MDTHAPKEIIVKLLDLNTVDKGFQKKYAAVYVQQDRKYVDMLIFNDESSFWKLLYNPYSKVKFTLKNLQTSQTYGASSIVMRLLKDLKGKQSHVLPLDGQTYAEMDIQNGFKPNIELEYQWKTIAERKDNLFKSDQEYDAGIKEALEKLRQLIEQLLELLNQELENDQEQNQEFLQYLEQRVADAVERITNEKQNVITICDNSRRTYEETKSLFNQYEAKDLEEADKIYKSSANIQNLINLIDANIEEAKKKNLEIRKNTGAVATLSNDAKQIRIQEEEKRHKVKSVIDNILARITQIELESLNELHSASQNKGLHEAEEATKLFDEVLKLDKELVKPYAIDRDLLEKREMYDDRIHNVRILEKEVSILGSTLESLEKEIDSNEHDLQRLHNQRQKQIQENWRLEKLLKELEEKEQREAKKLELLREKVTPVKDISLTTTRRVTQHRSKSKVATATMKINLNGSDIEYVNTEMQPDKLSSTLVGTKHNRARARSELGEGESKWKQKINILYEGVDELYTPTTREMDQRAEIHRILDELKEIRIRTEKLASLLDELNSEKLAIENENLRIMKEELAKKFTADEAHINRIRMQIRSTQEENEEKAKLLKSHRAKSKELTTKFKKLLEMRESYINQINILKSRLEERAHEEDRRLAAFEESKKQSSKQKEIDEEIKKLRAQIAEIDRQIADLKVQVADLEYELTVIQERITLKITINRKRQAEDRPPEYIPDRSDPIDVKIAEYLNVDDTRVPIRRLEKGLYMFGRKKIQISQDAKQKGGYKVHIPSENKTISIDELLTTYAENEIKLLSKIREDQELVVGEGDETIRAASPNARRGVPTFG